MALAERSGPTFRPHERVGAEVSCAHFGVDERHAVWFYPSNIGRSATRFSRLFREVKVRQHDVP